MAKAIKIISFTIVFTILLILVVSFFAEVDELSAFFRGDITSISIPRQAKIYEFSLIDRLPIIILVASMLIVFFLFCGDKSR